MSAIRSDENLLISTASVWFCSTEMHLFTSSYVKFASNSHRLTVKRRKSSRNYEERKGNCSDRGKAHSAQRWTLSDHPIRYKTTDRFPPTTNPKPLSALQPSSAHRQTDSPVPSPSALPGFATGLSAFNAKTTWITVKQHLKKTLITLTHLP